MANFCARFPTYKPLGYLNAYKGPRNNRVLSKVGFAEFISEDEARLFADLVKGQSFTVAGVQIKVRPAKTKFNSSRDWALKKAEELLQGAASSSQVVKLSFSDRKVTVNNEDAFVQSKTDSRGSFCGDFTHLALP